MDLWGAVRFTVYRTWWAGRDWLQPPLRLMGRVGLRPGAQVVDYGCGAGSYSLPAAVLTGPSGHVFAADNDPLALHRVRRVIREGGAANVTVVETDCRLPLPAHSVDVVLLLDVIHAVADQQAVLSELHRVLKADGLLVARSHHLSARRLEALLTERGLFRFESRSRGLHRFVPQQGTSETAQPNC